MAYSMTGFGKSQGNFKQSNASVEIRSVNNRFQEIYIRLPKMYSFLEYDVRELIRKNIERGKISVIVNINDEAGTSQSYKLNSDLVKSYTQMLKELQELSGINEDIKIEHLLALPDLIKQNENTAIGDDFKAFLMNLVMDGINDFNKMRSAEANELIIDMKSRNNHIKTVVEFVKSENKGAVKEEFDKLYKRLNENLNLGSIDSSRLEMELALISDKIDITEECVRLESHLILFDDAFKKTDSIGKRLNFILQEMNREINTIGSKTSKVVVAHKIVEAKEELEKIREQVQNLE